MCTEIRAVESNNEKAIAFGLSIITAAFSIGVAQHVTAIFLIIPEALVGVFLYATTLYTYVFSMGGYKAYLEDRLNGLAGQKILFWERMVIVRQSFNPTRPALVAIYLFIGVILGAVSEAYIKIEYGLPVMIGIALITAVLLYVLLIALRRMLGIYALIYEEATKAFRAKQP